MEKPPGVFGVELLRGTAVQRQRSASHQLKFGIGKASANRADEERYGADVWLDEGQGELKRRRRHGWQGDAERLQGQSRETEFRIWWPGATMYLAQSHSVNFIQVKLKW